MRLYDSLRVRYRVCLDLHHDQNTIYRSNKNRSYPMKKLRMKIITSDKEYA